MEKAAHSSLSARLLFVAEQLKTRLATPDETTSPEQALARAMCAQGRVLDPVGLASGRLWRAKRDAVENGKNETKT
jgi:hypothetical protein